MHSIHLDLDLNLSVNSLFCVIFLMENYEESIQEQSDSRAMAFWGYSCDGQSSAWRDTQALSVTWDS